MDSGGELETQLVSQPMRMVSQPSLDSMGVQVSTHLFCEGKAVSAFPQKSFDLNA